MGLCGSHPWQPRTDWELPTQISPKGTVFPSVSQPPSGCGLQPWLWRLQAYSPTEASESLWWGLKIWAALGGEWISLIPWLFSPSVFICRWNDSKMNSKALLKAGKGCCEKQSQAREWSARWGSPCPPVLFPSSGGSRGVFSVWASVMYWSPSACSAPFWPALCQAVIELPPTALVSFHQASLVARRVKRLPAMRETGVRTLGREDPLEKEMAPHSSTLAWKIP